MACPSLFKIARAPVQIFRLPFRPQRSLSTARVLLVFV